MGALAIPIIGAVLGGASGIASTMSQAKQAKRMQKEADKNRYAFSEDDRQAARGLLMHSLFGGMGQQGYGGMQMAPPPGQGGVPRNVTPQQIQMMQFMKMVQERYSRPTLGYQGYLQGLQERRDARSGVPLPPPQGAASSSAQRRNPSSSGGRSF